MYYAQCFSGWTVTFPTPEQLLDDSFSASQRRWSPFEPVRVEIRSVRGIALESLRQGNRPPGFGHLCAELGVVVCVSVSFRRIEKNGLVNELYMGYITRPLQYHAQVSL